MKCLLALTGFLLAGVVLASQPFVPGKQYEYKYEGRVASGLNGLPPQYAGLGIKANIVLTPRDPENVVVQIREPRIGKLNEKLRSEEAFYYEELPIQYSPLNQYSREIETPFLITMRTGLITSLEIPESEPTIIKNIKKSVASLIQMNVNGIEKVPRNVELLLPKYQDNSQKLSFTVMEESIMGVCETLYTISPLPEYLAQAEEKEVPVLLRDVTPEGHMVITKITNMGNCIKKSSFSHISPVSSECSLPEAQCQAKISKYSYTRYLIEGKRSNYLLKAIWNKGELIVRPAEADIKALTFQTMMLKSVQPGQAPQVPSGNKINLMYDMLSLTPEFKTLSPEQLMKQPIFPVQSVLNKQVPVEQIISKIEDLLKTISEKIEEYSKPKETVLPMRLLEVVKGIRMLKYEDLKTLSKKVLSGQLSSQYPWNSYVQSSPMIKETEKEIFLDCLAYAGTNPSILVIKDLISEGLLKGERAVQVLMTLPMTLSMPIPQVISTLVDITQLPQVKEHRQMLSTSILSMTNIAYHSCIEMNISRSSYPVHIFNGEICKPNHEVIISKVLPMLEQGLQSARSHHEKELYLRALGNLAHPKVLPVLKKYVRGSEQLKDVQLRTMAIFSLDRCSRLYPKEVRDMLVPVMNNVMDHYEPRIAAIAMILETSPPSVLLQQIALQTWFEPSVQVKSFVYSTFKSLSNNTYPTYNDTKMAKKAEIALHYTKPVAEGVHYSQNVYLTKYVPEQSLASKLQLFSVGSSDSLLPRRLYSKMSSYVHGAKYTPYKVSLFNQGTQTLINKLLFSDVAKKSSEKFSLDSFDFWSQSASDVLKQIKTDIKESDMPRGRLHFKLYEKMERIISYDETTQLIKKILQEDLLSLEYLQGEKEINIQKLMPLRESLITIPTEVGLPVVVSVRMPVFLSLRGKVRSEIQPSHIKPSTLLKNDPAVKLNIVADIRPMVSLQRIVKSTIVVPFMEEHPVAGYEQLLQNSLPGKLIVKLDTAEKVVETEYVPLEVPEVAVAHHHVRPFTAIEKPTELKPVVESSSFKLIKRDVRPVEKSFSFGQKYLGIDLRFDVKTEESVSDFSSIYHYLVRHNPLSLLNFYYVLPAPIYNKEATLVYRPETSETKSFKMVTKFETKPIDSQYQKEEYRMEDYKPSRIYPNSIYVEVPPTKKILDSRVPRDLKISSMVKEIKYKYTYEHILKSEVKLTGRQERIYKAQLSITNTTEPTIRSIKTALNLELVKVPSVTPVQTKITTEYQIPVIKATKLEELISSVPKSVMWIEVKLPESQKINIGIDFKRSEEQKRFVESSPEKKRCLEDEQKGLEYSYNCSIARLQATTLNEMHIEIVKEGQPITPKYYKMLYAVDSFIKYILYPHMQNDPLEKNEKHQTVDIIVKREPYKQMWDIIMKKPYEITYFYNLRECKPLRYILPFNTLLTRSRLMADYAFKGKYYPTCKVMQNYLTTLDNITLPLKPSSPKCWHLLMKDCSEVSKMGVFVKPSPYGKELKVVLGQTEVRLEPTKPLPKLYIDNKEVPLTVENIQKNPIYIMKEKYVVAKISVLPEMQVMIESPVYKFVLYHDGESVVFEPSNMYRGRTCGLCGDFNGEKYADLKTPELCALNTTKVREYFDSWILPQDSCKPVPIPKSECYPLEYIPTGEFAEKRASLKSNRYSEESYEMRPMEIPARRGYRCYSLTPVKVCKYGYVPESYRQEQIEFYCAPEGVYVPEERRKVDLHEYKEIPTRCVRV